MLATELDDDRVFAEDRDTDQALVDRDKDRALEGETVKRLERLRPRPRELGLAVVDDTTRRRRRRGLLGPAFPDPRVDFELRPVFPEVVTKSTYSIGRLSGRLPGCRLAGRRRFEFELASVVLPVRLIMLLLGAMF